MEGYCNYEIKQDISPQCNESPTKRQSGNHSHNGTADIQTNAEATENQICERSDNLAMTAAETQ